MSVKIGTNYYFDEKCQDHFGKYSHTCKHGEFFWETKKYQRFNKLASSDYVYDENGRKYLVSMFKENVLKKLVMETFIDREFS